MSPPKLQVVELNPHLSCILCGGYYIDATTITECLHSFCRACIVRYLETSKYCPVCEVQIHKTRPLRCIRPDKTLQDIVYKIVPGLFQNEMKNRRELYASQPPEAIQCSRDPEDRGEITDDRYIYTTDELFSIILQYRNKTSKSETESKSHNEEEDSDVRRCLRCRAAVKILHLKKFIRFKFNIPNNLMISLEYSSEVLQDDYSLLDVAYIFDWKRSGPFEFNFCIVKRPKARRKQPTMCSKDSETLRSDNAAVDTKLNTDESNDVCKVEIPKKVPTPSPPKNKTESRNSHNVKTLESPKMKTNPEVPLKKPKFSKTSKAQKCDSTPPKAPKDSSVAGSPCIDKKSEITIKKDDAEVVDRVATPKISPASPLADRVELISLKVPKLTIPLTPKILQQAAQHAKEDSLDLDNDLYEGRLIIAEPDASPKEDDKAPTHGDTSKGKDTDDEVDSGRGSETSSRTEARSLCGDDDLGSPGSSSLHSPGSEKQSPFSAPFPMQLPCLPPPRGAPRPHFGISHSGPGTSKDDFGVLDLSLCHRGRPPNGIPFPRGKPVANPAILDKLRQTAPCLVVPKHPSYKIFPQSIPRALGTCKKPLAAPGIFRYKGSLTAFNPDPNSGRPKIVIKNLDPRPEQRHHPYQHHHHGHHHHKM